MSCQGWKKNGYYFNKNEWKILCKNASEISNYAAPINKTFNDKFIQISKNKYSTQLKHKLGLRLPEWMAQKYLFIHSKTTRDSLSKFS